MLFLCFFCVGVKGLLTTIVVCTSKYRCCRFCGIFFGIFLGITAFFFNTLSSLVRQRHRTFPDGRALPCVDVTVCLSLFGGELFVVVVVVV